MPCSESGGWAEDPATQSSARSAINGAGAITGVYVDVNNNEHGFLRSPKGAFTTFDVPGGSLATFPISLNLEGAVIGYYFNANRVFRSFLRRPDGTFATWTGPGGCDTTPGNGCYGSGAFGINVFGTVASTYEDNNFVGHGLVRSFDGKLITYDVPGAGTGAYQGTNCPGCSIPLNNLGALAGFYIDSSGMTHGYVRSPWGEMTTFDVPGENPTYGIGCAAD
jgi:hypothetical protein